MVQRSDGGRIVRAPDTSNKPGKVYLIGAGPGDPELLTLRGLRYLMQADVVLYDRLIDPRLLQYAPSSARLVSVGKAAGQSKSQEWIQRLMITEARQGRQVVRLKGGDPFVFGRGGEEAVAIAQAGLACEIVPGVTSAIAVPALAGIPVLHRDHASTLTLVSGHNVRPSAIDAWAKSLIPSGTLVVLMGVAHLARIAHGLQQAGVAADIPVAVTKSGLDGGAQTVISTLSQVGSDASHITAPAVIVIGRVVTVREQINVCHERPQLGLSCLAERRLG